MKLAHTLTRLAFYISETELLAVFGVHYRGSIPVLDFVRFDEDDDTFSATITINKQHYCLTPLKKDHLVVQLSDPKLPWPHFGATEAQFIERREGEFEIIVKKDNLVRCRSNIRTRKQLVQPKPAPPPTKDFEISIKSQNISFVLRADEEQAKSVLQLLTL